MKYIGLVDTAKLIRVQLKKNFPGIKFSVRSSSFANGSSVDISWTDGPTESAVDSITGVFAYGCFDAMIDMSYSVDSWLLPDGSAMVAKSPGSTGSMGVEPAFENPQPEGAERVSFGAKFVMVQRTISDAADMETALRIATDFGVDAQDIERLKAGTVKTWDFRVENARETLSNLVHRELCKKDLTPAPKPEAKPEALETATLSENEGLDGLEIRFPSKPPEDTRNSLKAAGWRWSRHNGCWYHRRTDTARNFAAELVGVSA